VEEEDQRQCFLSSQVGAICQDENQRVGFQGSYPASEPATEVGRVAEC